MRARLFPILSLFAALATAATTPAAERHREPDEPPRVVVLTDISNEPDDEESLVRFLVYANEFDVEGLIATTSTWLRDRTREDLIRRQIDAYAQVRDRLLLHAPGFPTAEQLRAVTRTGQPGYGMASVGDGKSTPGSRHLIEVVDRADARPVWITIWGGANTLAQALHDVKATRDAAALARFVSRIRVYAIADQDDSGRWLRDTFPGLFYIVSPSTTDHREYYRSTWSGISGDRLHRTGVMHKFDLVDAPWLKEHIQSHGPLGALYPTPTVLMEGDTPSFLGLINNGLGWHVQPSYGGWGGRYARYQATGESRPIWTDNDDSRDTVTSDNGRTDTSNQATIWRWREPFQNDFAARMDWTITEAYGKANHNPTAVLNGDRSRKVLEITARPGETVQLSAEGSADPDGDRFKTRWWVYREAGSYRGEVRLTSEMGPRTGFTAPEVRRPETLHVILELRDDGIPNLFAYRRAVVKIQP